MPGKLFVRVIADLEPTTIADRYCQDTFVVTKSMEWQVVFGLWSRQRRLIGADLLQPFSAFSKKPRRISLPLLHLDNGVAPALYCSLEVLHCSLTELMQIVNKRTGLRTDVLCGKPFQSLGFVIGELLSQALLSPIKVLAMCSGRKVYLFFA